MRRVTILTAAGLLSTTGIVYAQDATTTTPWSITGNSGTTTSDFLGTISDEPLIFRADDKEALRILPSGYIGIGTATPGVRLDVDGSVRATGFYLPTGAATGLVLTSNATGTAGWAAAKAGPTGPAGAKGATGATGATGAAGAKGATGETGATGAAGAKGATGAAGAVGAAGAKGATGETGATGAAGAKGATGAAGAVGAAGAKGATGETGATGTAGAKGATGATGVAGAAGATGAAGAKGATGAEGPEGPTGAVGAAGPQGTAGAKGATGTTGATGAQGPAGFVTLPYAASVSSTSQLFEITNSGGADTMDLFVTGGSGTSYGNTINAAHDGGSTSAIGAYGSAGYFYGINAMNTSPSVYGLTNGAGGAGFFVTTTVDTNVSDSNSNPATVTGINEGGSTLTIGAYGPAGYFETTNVDNSSGTLEGLSYGQGGRGVVGVIYNGGYGVHAEDDTAAGFSIAGYGLEAVSLHGIAARVVGGSGGSGNCYFAGGAGWDCSSDRNLKQDFVPVDGAALLDRLADMPVFTYRMKNSDDHALFLGPTSQDFKAAFGLGVSDVTINTANAQGVAIAAAKELYAKLKQDEATIASLQARVAEQDAKLTAMASLQASVERLETAVRQVSAGRAVVRASLTKP